MRILRQLLATAAICLPSLAAAQNDVVQSGPPPGWVTDSEPLAVPDDATGLVFIRRQLENIREKQNQAHDMVWNDIEMYLDAEKLLPYDFDPRHDTLQLNSSVGAIFSYRHGEEQHGPSNIDIIMSLLK